MMNTGRGERIEIVHGSCISMTVDKKLIESAIAIENTDIIDDCLFQLESFPLLCDSNTKFNIDVVKSFISTYDQCDSNKDGLQAVINKIVDLELCHLKQRIQGKNSGKIAVPELHQTFATGSSFWAVTGDFHARKGTFKDLASLRRIKDAALSHTEFTINASCAFNLSKAKIKYRKYKLRYGVISMKGKLSASVRDVSLTVGMSLNYNQVPCQAVLQELRLSNHGKIKIKATGQGPLNKLLSKLATWVTQKWQDDIVIQVEKELSRAINTYLENFNCRQSENS